MVTVLFAYFADPTIVVAAAPHFYLDGMSIWSTTELEVPVDVVFAEDSFQHMLHFKIACAHEGFVVDRVQPMSSQLFNPHDYRDKDINDDDDDFEDMDGDDDEEGLAFDNLSEPVQTAIENFLEDCGITDKLSADTHSRV